MASATSKSPRPLRASDPQAQDAMLHRAPAVNIARDENRIWKGRTLGLFSFPNVNNKDSWISVRLSDFDNPPACQISLDEGILQGDHDTAITYPTGLTPVFSSLVDNPLVPSHSSQQNTFWVIFKIPARRRVHLAIQLTADRVNSLDFQVVCEQLSEPRLDRAIPGRSVSRRLEWVPAPSAAEVEVWLSPSEPILFRPWNIRSGHWSWLGRVLPWLHRPECVVMVRNYGSQAVQVSPQVSLMREGQSEDKGRIQKLEGKVLAARGEEGDGFEFPCGLWLEDRRSPDKEASGLRIGASVRVQDTAGQLLAERVAGEPLTGEFERWLFPLRDKVALFLLVLFCLFLPFWVLVGVPVRVVPEFAVQLQFQGMNRGEFPEGVSPDNLNFTLHEGPSGIDAKLFKYDGKAFRFTLPPTIAWLRPFGFREIERQFAPNLQDDAKKYKFTLPEQVSFTVVPRSREPQLLKNIGYQYSDMQDNIRAAAEKIPKAEKLLQEAQTLLDQKQSAKSQLEAADKEMTDIQRLLEKTPPSPEKERMDALAKTLTALKARQEKVTQAPSQDPQNAQLANEYLGQAEQHIADGRANINDKAQAQQMVNQATTALGNAMEKIAYIQDQGLKSQLETRKSKIDGKLDQLRLALKNGGGGGDPPPDPNIALTGSLLQDAEKAIRQGRASLPRDKQGATHSANQAESLLDDAESTLGKIAETAPEKATLRNQLEAARNSLRGLREAIRNTPDPVTPSNWRQAYASLLRGDENETARQTTGKNDAESLGLRAIALVQQAAQSSDATALMEEAQKTIGQGMAVVNAGKATREAQALLLVAQGDWERRTLRMQGTDPEASENTPFMENYTRAMQIAPHLEYPYIVAIRSNLLKYARTQSVTRRRYRDEAQRLYAQGNRTIPGFANALKTSGAVDASGIRVLSP